MRNYVVVCLLITCISFLNTLSALEKRPAAISLTSSVIIPCHSCHAKFLPKLFDAYAEQTILPDEIVVSLSSADQIADEIMNEIKSSRWPFPIVLICNEKYLFAGANRNLACQAAIGDIYILQDADDLPHSQRVEIIKYFFENYPIDHLMHSFTTHFQNLPVIDDVSQIEWFVPEGYAPSLGHNGVVSFTKKVFEKAQYDPDLRFGQDVEFNRLVYSKFANRVVLTTKLYYYDEYHHAPIGICNGKK